MKYTLLVAALGFTGFLAHAAYAGEGAGDPFPYRAPGVTTSFNGYKTMPNAMADPYPFRGHPHIVTQAERDSMVPVEGSQAPVQSLNSLPPGFENGMPGYAQMQPASRPAVAQAARNGTHG